MSINLDKQNSSSNNGNSSDGQPLIINNINNIKVEGLYGKAKNKWIAFILCFFLGYFGAHKFYEGKILMGFLYLFTAGFIGFGWLIDCIILLTKPNPYFV